ncbi:hypothetical protein BV20DRAFT_59045 [Pilatotrama ljubarskyi]|nr:hypothetical protein BV20DRAFT_59045 [Pilatotrama ljubarskyi]
MEVRRRGRRRGGFLYLLAVARNVGETFTRPRKASIRESHDSARLRQSAEFDQVHRFTCASTRLTAQIMVVVPARRCSEMTKNPRGLGIPTGALIDMLVLGLREPGCPIARYAKAERGTPRVLTGRHSDSGAPRAALRQSWGHRATSSACRTPKVQLPRLQPARRAIFASSTISRVLSQLHASRISACRRNASETTSRLRGLSRTSAMKAYTTLRPRHELGPRRTSLLRGPSHRKFVTYESVHSPTRSGDPAGIMNA